MKPKIIHIIDRTEILNHYTDNRKHEIIFNLEEHGTTKIDLSCTDFLSLDDIEDLERHYTNLVNQMKAYRQSIRGES